VPPDCIICLCMPSIDSSIDLAAARSASANFFHAGICASVILRSALSAATRSPAWDSFSRIIDIICVMQVMSPPIMSQPFTMSSPFISPPIMGVVWAVAANAANAIVAAMERPDKGRET
jgi:hypothetical protein